MDVRPCPRCRAQTWTGVEDSNRAALPYRLNPEPVDTLGELSAVVAGLRTWTQHWNGDVHLRGVQAIAQWPAGRTPRQAVHADHACGQGEA